MPRSYTEIENKYRHHDGRKMDYFSDVDCDVESITIPDKDARLLGILDVDSHPSLKGPMGNHYQDKYVFILRKGNKHYLVNTEGFEYCKYICPCTIEPPVTLVNGISGDRIEQLRAMAGKLDGEDLTILVSLYGLNLAREMNSDMAGDGEEVTTLGIDMVDMVADIMHDNLDVKDCINRHNLAPYYDIEVTEKVVVKFKNP